MKAIIVADGPSSKGFTPPPNIPIIAVKGAIDWLPRADYWFSLDPNQRTMNYLNNQKEGVKYYCACDPNTLLPEGVIRLTRIAHRGKEPKPPSTPRWWLWRWSAVCGLNKQTGCINTGNSAYGALGLAFHLKFDDILLVGVDGNRKPRLSDNSKPNNLSHLPLLFESALPDIKISSITKLGRIPKTTLAEWLEQ